MEQVTATISDDDKVWVEHITAWLEQSSALAGRRAWCGYFELPEGIYLPAGGPYTFKTGDGRTGQILISYERAGSNQGMQVLFNGRGHFR